MADDLYKGINENYFTVKNREAGHTEFSIKDSIGLNRPNIIIVFVIVALKILAAFVAGFLLVALLVQVDRAIGMGFNGTRGGRKIVVWSGIVFGSGVLYFLFIHIRRGKISYQDYKNFKISAQQGHVKYLGYTYDYKSWGGFTTNQDPAPTLPQQKPISHINLLINEVSYGAGFKIMYQPHVTAEIVNQSNMLISEGLQNIAVDSAINSVPNDHNANDWE